MGCGMTTEIRFSVRYIKGTYRSDRPTPQSASPSGQYHQFKGFAFLGQGYYKEIKRLPSRRAPFLAPPRKGGGKEGGSGRGFGALPLPKNPPPIPLPASALSLFLSGSVGNRRCNFSLVRLPPMAAGNDCRPRPLPYGGTGGNFVVLWSLKSDCPVTLFSLIHG